MHGHLCMHLAFWPVLDMACDSSDLHTCVPSEYHTARMSYSDC